MSFKNICLFSLVFSFLCSNGEAQTFNIKGKADVSPVYMGSEWGLGIFAASVEAQRLLPIIYYLRGAQLEKFAKIIAQREDVQDIFDKLSESQLKEEIRRQYYLFTNGEFLDNFPISFSILELLNAGFLYKRVEEAKKTGALDLSNLRISTLYGLFELLDQISPLIKELDLSKNELTVIRKDDFLYYLARLERLDLSYNKIEILEEGCFDQLLNLRFLDLGHNKIASIPSFLFAQLSNLWGLDLSDNAIQFLDKKMFFGIDNLKKLNLSDNKIKKIMPDLEAWIKSLEEYDFEGNEVKIK